MTRLLRAAILTMLMACFVYAGSSFAAGGICPSGASYLQQVMDAQQLPLVTLASLGVTNCYYIAASGSDSNSGTNESSPWAHLPYMPTCTSNCLALQNEGIQPGTGFIMRGGDTWGSANLGFHWNKGGTATNPIYIGVDPGWPATGWARPIWNIQKATMPTWMWVASAHFVIVDNIEATGLNQVGNNAQYYFGLCAQNVTMERLYIHGWGHDSTATGNASSGFSPGCGTNIQGTTVRYTVIDGSDSSKDMLSGVFGSLPNAYGNYIRYVLTCILGNGDNWHDNLCEWLVPYDPSGKLTHQDGFYHETQYYSPNTLIYNNVVRNIPYTTTGGAVKYWINGVGPCPFSSCTSYFFNNIAYNTYGMQQIDTAAHGAGNFGTWYLFNNTIQCGIDSAPSSCQELGDQGNAGGTMTLHSINNYWIGTSTTEFNCRQSTFTCVSTSPLFQTIAQANAQGYSDTGTYAFQPTSAKGFTATTQATNTQSLCEAIGEVDANAGAACQSDTSYACTYDPTAHVVSCPARVTVARAAGPNIGAYQFSSTQASTPTPPMGLTVSVQ